MKAVPIRILMYGSDAQLLETRQWLLQSRGYRVATVVELAGIDRLALEPAVRLLLLCHSLSAAEGEAAVARAEARWPGTKHLVMIAESARNPTGILGQLLHTLDGPSRLIAQVGDLVGTSAGAAMQI